VLAATCWFLLEIAYGWVMLVLPSSGMIPLFITGLVVVGAVLGFTVCAGANFILRAGPPTLRVPLSALAWLVFAGVAVWMLLNAGSDPRRTCIAAALAIPSGLLIGPYWAETILAAWFLKRLARRQSNNS
jgi:hypothetical protein